MKKRMVIYYSFEGSTQKAAKAIAEKLGADIVQIKTVHSIPNSGMKKFLVGGMQATFKMCPKLQAIDYDISQYEEIVLGTPIWAGICAPAVNSFLKTKGVKDKITAVFTCSGGGDNEKCMEDFSKRLPALRHSVALADYNGTLSKENDTRIQTFVEEIVNGE